MGQENFQKNIWYIYIPRNKKIYINRDYTLHDINGWSY